MQHVPTDAASSWELVKTLVSAIALLVSGASFYFSLSAARRARRFQNIMALLGEKESVAFAALKLIRDGLPSSKSETKATIQAVVQACVFESSSRARALLYRVIHDNYKRYPSWMDEAVRSVEETFAATKKYQLPDGDLDVSHGIERLNAVKKVIDASRRRQSD